MAIDSPSLKPPSSIAGICTRDKGVHFQRIRKRQPVILLAYLSGGVHREIFGALRALLSVHAWRHLVGLRMCAIVKPHQARATRLKANAGITKPRRRKGICSCLRDAMADRLESEWGLLEEAGPHDRAHGLRHLARSALSRITRVAAETGALVPARRKFSAFTLMKNKIGGLLLFCVASGTLFE